MKIGITGGTGFIGQYLLKGYCKEYKFVAITSRTDTKNLFQDKNIEYVKEEYDEKGFQKAFKDCEAVVHLGAVRSNKELEESVENYFVNIKVAEALFKACWKLQINNVVNISSIAVYDAETTYPYQEKNMPNPLSNYGIAKLAIENIARIFNRKKSMNIKSLRLAQVMGIGERPGYMLSVFLEKCLKRERLSLFGTGKYGRDYIYVKDVVRAIFCALNAPEKRGVYNIGMGQLTTNLELAQKFCEVFENNEGYQLLDKPEVQENYLMDVELAKTEIGFETKYSVCEALKDMKKILQEKEHENC